MEPNENYDIFMAISREIGHDKRGMPKYKTTNYGHPKYDETGQMVIDIDTDDITSNYKKFLAEKLEDTDHAFVVKYKEVKQKDRLDAAPFNPVASKIVLDIEKYLPENWMMKEVGDVTKSIFYSGHI